MVATVIPVPSRDAVPLPSYWGSLSQFADYMDRGVLWVVRWFRLVRAFYSVGFFLVTLWFG